MKQRTISPGILIAAVIGMFLMAAGFNSPKKQDQQHSESVGKCTNQLPVCPVKRTSLPADGTILGIVVPFSVQTKVLAISVADTIASTDSDTTNGAYILKDVPPGNYALTYIPSDKRYRKNSTRVAVSDGQITIADTIWLMK